MEYIQGDDLKYHLDKGVRYSLEQSLKIIRDLLSALDYAHRQGIVHRDIKPANLLIEPGGRVKLTDFGVARMQDSGESTRTQGSMVGTLKYMSPEQVQGQKIDARADLFSVAVVLYQLLTDKRPFDGDNDFSIIHQIIGHTPAPPSSFNARLPTAIDAVVARGLAKDRDQRFATARDFASALQSAIRRAEDATIVPPADPFKKKDGLGTGSTSRQPVPSGSNSLSGGSIVTQEVELVYWKDVKDSTDPEELEGFLAKFPAGIYADLAHRRLRKLSAASDPLPEHTILSGRDTDAHEDLEATRLRSGSTTSFAHVPASGNAAVPDAGTPQTDTGLPDESIAAKPITPTPYEGSTTTLPADYTQFTPTIIEPRIDPLPATEEPATDHDATKALSAPSEPSPRSSPRRRPSVAALAGIAVVIGIVVLITTSGGMGDKRLPTPVSGASAPPEAVAVGVPAVTPQEGPGVPGTIVPASAALPVVAASASLPAAASASVAVAAASADAPRPNLLRRLIAASKARLASMSASPNTPMAAETPKTAVAASAPRGEEPRSVATVIPAAVGTAPGSTTSGVEVCRDKIFLARQFCLAEQCEKPSAKNHPLCVRFREEAKIREDSKLSN
jgi:serine/threonine protein kinase